MLSQKRRIPRKMFPLLNGVKTFKNNLFLLRFAPKSESNNRFCFSVSKKVAKNAVVRNGLRRVGYRLLEKYIAQIPPNTIALFSFMVVPKDNQEIAQKLESILKESKLIK